MGGGFEEWAVQVFGKRPEAPESHEVRAAEERARAMRRALDEQRIWDERTSAALRAWRLTDDDKGQSYRSEEVENEHREFDAWWDENNRAAGKVGSKAHATAAFNGWRAASAGEPKKNPYRHGAPAYRRAWNAGYEARSIVERGGESNPAEAVQVRIGNT